MFLSHESRDRKKMERSIAYLKKKERILFITTSNRWKGDPQKDVPKSTRLAEHMMQRVGASKVTLVDATELAIFPCEGNISTARGNTCGVKGAVLKNEYKNPSGHHRCWASINNPDDELWKISKPLLASDCVVFFGSVRWGQMNSFYQKLIERLTWLENRKSTLQEEGVLEGIDAGIIVIGHNWNGAVVMDTQKEVLNSFGFHIVNALCFEWHFTDLYDETAASYQNAPRAFAKTFLEEE